MKSCSLQRPLAIWRVRPGARIFGPRQATLRVREMKSLSLKRLLANLPGALLALGKSTKLACERDARNRGQQAAAARLQIEISGARARSAKIYLLHSDQD